MKTEGFVIIVDNVDEITFSLEELCEICVVSPEFIHSLVDYGVISPNDQSLENWHFNLNHLYRIKTAMRLQKDLEINLAGVALAIDLLDELEKMRAKTALMNVFFQR